METKGNRETKRQHPKVWAHKLMGSHLYTLRSWRNSHADKKATSRLYRRLARRDPEHAPKRYRFWCWVGW